MLKNYACKKNNAEITLKKIKSGNILNLLSNTAKGHFVKGHFVKGHFLNEDSKVKR